MPCRTYSSFKVDGNRDKRRVRAAVQKETTMASTKAISTGNREKWLDLRGIWKLKIIELGDLFE